MRHSHSQGCSYEGRQGTVTTHTGFCGTFAHPSHRALFTLHRPNSRATAENPLEPCVCFLLAIDDIYGRAEQTVLLKIFISMKIKISMIALFCWCVHAHFFPSVKLFLWNNVHGDNFKNCDLRTLLPLLKLIVCFWCLVFLCTGPL